MQRRSTRSPRAATAALFALVATFHVPARAEPISGKVFTNSLGMEFVRIQPGRFTMGAGMDPMSGGRGGPAYDERPAHEVRLTEPYYILRGKVSPAEYRQAGLPGMAGDVSWNLAAAFCAWLGRREGRTYRLPTEAEWDYVRQEPRGTVELSGLEWVADWHGVYPVEAVTDPVGPATGLTKVVRGGASRASLPPDASGSQWGLGATTFRVVLVVDPPETPYVAPRPFSQAAVLQSTEPALRGPDPKVPYFTVRFALPIPPDDDTNSTGPLTGMDPSVLAHNHSPGFEILPNGDALAIYFSARDASGASESAPDTRFIQARLRYGAEEWDPPELFCDLKPLNDQSGLLWQDGDTLRFFGGGRGAPATVPFKMAVSTNCGATWTLTTPILDRPAADYTPQPVVNAFRDPGGALYFTMDAAGNRSFLWRSGDEGMHWHDMGGRTGGRHSTIIPLDERGRLLSIGGKNTGVDGWSPMNTSGDWGADWSGDRASPFPSLGSNQRPSLIRLANGHLCFVSDSYNRKTGLSPAGWQHGQGAIVAVSSDNGATWRIKRLPVELPNARDRKQGTLGYATVRQAPNGVIHVLTTMTEPCLHYEFNEAWVLSNAGDVPPETGGGTIRHYRENYPDGALRATWSARLCPHGRYLLEGQETSYYENGRKEHEVTYASGRRTGVEMYWAADGTKLWSWTHQPERDTSTWIHYWSNGRKRVESTWATRPRAHDLDRRFYGLVADGPVQRWNRDGRPVGTCTFTNGALAGELPLPAARP